MIFSKSFFTNTIRVSNSLDPDQDQQNAGPDLGPNCLQLILATTLIERVNKFFRMFKWQTE